MEQQSSPVFYLSKQPEVLQRKCYAKENRYLLPNPFQLIAKNDDSSFKNLEITICCVYENCQIPENDGAKYMQPFKTKVYNYLGPIEFTLKALKQTGGWVRLMISIKGLKDDVSFEETIYSGCFIIHAHKKVPRNIPPNAKDTFRIVTTNPSVCTVGKSTKLWIYGSFFALESFVLLTVRMDNIKCTVEWATSELIMCEVPAFINAGQKTLKMTYHFDQNIKISTEYTVSFVPDQQICTNSSLIMLPFTMTNLQSGLSYTVSQTSFQNLYSDLTDDDDNLKMLETQKTNLPDEMIPKKKRKIGGEVEIFKNDMNFDYNGMKIEKESLDFIQTCSTLKLTDLCNFFDLTHA
jgi:hypothetical protein